MLLFTPGAKRPQGREGQFGAYVGCRSLPQCGDGCNEVSDNISQSCWPNAEQRPTTEAEPPWATERELVFEIQNERKTQGAFHGARGAEQATA